VGEEWVKLRAESIQRNLGTKRIGRRVECLDEVDSTNDAAWASAAQAGVDGLAIFAEWQRRGRGRHGRPWISPPGRNLLLSILLVETAPAPPAEALTIAVGLAVAEAIEETTGLEAELKWPNDVRLRESKTAGVLVERRRVGKKPVSVVGIGVNVGAAPSTEKVDQPVTCLCDALGGPVDRTDLARAVLQRLDVWVEAVSAGRMEELHDAWITRCGMLQERVAAVSDGRRYVGRVADVSPLHGLILIDDHGIRLHLPASITNLEVLP
jgi:BirA family biotin operon repressor/biotin-[acetyl-CoA-carboxylase] ligase